MLSQRLRTTSQSCSGCSAKTRRAQPTFLRAMHATLPLMRPVRFPRPSAAAASKPCRSM